MLRLKFFISILLAHTFIFQYVFTLPEQGYWKKDLKPNNSLSLSSYSKIMYNNTLIYTTIDCKSTKKTEIEIQWMLQISECADEFYNMDVGRENAYFTYPNISQFKNIKSVIQYKKSKPVVFTCGHPISLTYENVDIIEVNLAKKVMAITTNQTNKKNRAKRADAPKKQPSTSSAATPKTPITPKSVESLHGLTTETWDSGAFLYLLQIKCKTSPCDFKATAIVQMKNSYGYLSAIEWPFLIFYGIMSFVYLIFGIFWLVCSACFWRDLLRVQFWIGAVILLGMLEKAFFYAEYQAINSTGKSIPGSVVFAEIVSCVKRTLARLLVMVVCIGYGIVKPRLGPALRKVVSIGVIYFLCALTEGCIRVLHPRFEPSKILLYALIPTVIVDVVICWWTFTYLIQTIKQMRLRRNTVKFNLYRHFSNILILIIVVSVVFMVWSIYSTKLWPCKNWQNLWVDEAFWHILFSVILMVIIWLWRPSNNNQRYAYSPVLDADDMDDEDVLMDNMTTGDVRKKSSESNKVKTKDRKSASTEDDLKWIEEHIPATAAEQVYPLLDSDEEITTSKLSASKMD